MNRSTKVLLQPLLDVDTYAGLQRIPAAML